MSEWKELIRENLEADIKELQQENSLLKLNNAHSKAEKKIHDKEQ